MTKHAFFLLAASADFFIPLAQRMLHHEGSDRLHLSALSYYSRDHDDLSAFQTVLYFEDALRASNYETRLCKTSDVIAEVMRIENQYELCLSELIHAERHFQRFTGDEQIRICLNMITQFEEINKKNEIDIIISAGLADFFSLFLYYFSKTNNKPFVYLMRNRFGTGLYLSGDLRGAPLPNPMARCTSDFSLAETKEYFNNYLDTHQQPSYMHGNSSTFNAYTWKDLSSLFQVMRVRNRKYSFHAYDGPLQVLTRRLSRVISRHHYGNLLKKYGVTRDALNEIKYFVYPLHFHPEASTLIQGRWIHEQSQIIRAISRVLPADYLLIVKEHRVSIGRWPKRFYESFVKFHNVRLIDHTTDPHLLISNATGVVTISSSMGLEAILHGKPVICFGDVHYNSISGVIRATDFSKIHEAIKSAIDFPGYNSDEVIGFLNNILSVSVFPKYNFNPHNFKTEHVDLMFELIAPFLKGVASR